MQFVPLPPEYGCFGNCLVSYTVLPTEAAPTVIIRRLTILRPELENVFVALGNVSGPYLARADEIRTEPQGDPQDPNGLRGHVSVQAYLNGTLGPVDNVNALIARTDNGNIEGPINAVMHPQSAPKPELGNPRNSLMELLSNSGSLVGDTTMAPSPGPNSVRGIITVLDFPLGTIGTSAQRINIRADGAIAQVRAKAMNADIGGTAAPGMSSFVNLLADLEVGSSAPASAEFVGEIRAEHACASPDYADENGAPTVSGQWRFYRPMNGRIFIEDLRRKLSPNDTWIALPLVPVGLKGTISLRSLDQTVSAAAAWGNPIALQGCGFCPPDPDDPLTFTVDDGGGYIPPRSAASVGGGAVGVAPFIPHADDCVPPFPEENMERVLHPSDAPTPDDPIQVRHYGPVKRPGGGQRAYTVVARLLSESTWTDISVCFAEDLDAVGTAVLLKPTRKMPGGFEYRIIQNQDGQGKNLLLSDLPESCEPDGVPVANFPREYRFRVCDGVPYGDANSDAVVDFADMTASCRTSG